MHGVSEAESSQRLKQLADYLEITDVLDKFPSRCPAASVSVLRQQGL
ncbi:hypothetical protein [Emergencia timonensis]